MEKLSFEEISKDILKNRKFQKITKEAHHGITRMDHTLRVSKYVYKISKKLNLDYVSATRAALLHDFFTTEDFGPKDNVNHMVTHPDIAVQNARGEFEINDIESNSIECHMFPLNMKVPKYKEGWVLTMVDKGVAIYECALYKFAYRNVKTTVNRALNLAVILLFYIITMEHK